MLHILPNLKYPLVLMCHLHNWTNIPDYGGFTEKRIKKNFSKSSKTQQIPKREYQVF